MEYDRGFKIGEDAEQLVLRTLQKFHRLCYLASAAAAVDVAQDVGRARLNVGGLVCMILPIVMLPRVFKHEAELQKRIK